MGLEFLFGRTTRVVGVERGKWRVLLAEIKLAGMDKHREQQAAGTRWWAFERAGWPEGVASYL